MSVCVAGEVVDGQVLAIVGRGRVTGERKCGEKNKQDSNLHLMKLALAENPSVTSE